jgi:hypothetical protein
MEGGSKQDQTSEATMNNLPKPRPAVQRKVLGVLGAYRHGIAPAFALPIHGRYCGPGHGDSTGCTAPADEVDAVCCRHDVCYGKRGYFDCGCDCELVASMPAAIASEAAKGNVAAVAAGTAAAAFFAVSPCLCKICLPFIGCFKIPLAAPLKCLC